MDKVQRARPAAGATADHIPLPFLGIGRGASLSKGGEHLLFLPA